MTRSLQISPAHPHCLVFLTACALGSSLLVRGSLRFHILPAGLPRAPQPALLLSQRARMTALLNGASTLDHGVTVAGQDHEGALTTGRAG